MALITLNQGLWLFFSSLVPVRGWICFLAQCSLLDGDLHQNRCQRNGSVEFCSERKQRLKYMEMSLMGKMSWELHSQLDVGWVLMIWEFCRRKLKVQLVPLRRFISSNVDRVCSIGHVFVCDTSLASPASSSQLLSDSSWGEHGGSIGLSKWRCPWKTWFCNASSTKRMQLRAASVMLFTWK